MKVWVIDFIDGDRIVCGTAEKAYNELKAYIENAFYSFDDESIREAALRRLERDYHNNQDVFGVEIIGWADATTVL